MCQIPFGNEKVVAAAEEDEEEVNEETLLVTVVPILEAETRVVHRTHTPCECLWDRVL